MDDPAQLCGGSERPGSAAVARSAMMKVSFLLPGCTNTCCEMFHYILFFYTLVWLKGTIIVTSFSFGCKLIYF